MLEHKAYLFDFRRFEAELLSILQEALATADCEELIAFVRDNVVSLTDPYEGQPLAAGWEAMIVATDAHQYGDLALTKYYDPADDIGPRYRIWLRAMAPLLRRQSWAGRSGRQQIHSIRASWALIFKAKSKCAKIFSACEEYPSCLRLPECKPQLKCSGERRNYALGCT